MVTSGRATASDSNWVEIVAPHLSPAWADAWDVPRHSQQAQVILKGTCMICVFNDILFVYDYGIYLL